MAELPKYDWNAVAAGMQFVPAEAIKVALEAGPGFDALRESWETIWKQGLAAMGLPSDDVTLHNKMVGEIMLGFYKAEALRRGI